MSLPILSIRRPWPWGLVLVSDALSRDPLPTSMGAEAVVSAGTALAARVLHEVDGDALVEVTLGDPGPTDLHKVFEGPLLVASGQVVIGDAGGERTETIKVQPGPYLVRIFVDDRDQPSRLVVALWHA